MTGAPPKGAAFAVALLVAGTFFVGCSPLFVRWSELGPIATAFYRVGLAFPLLFAWQVWDAGLPGTKANFPKPGRRDYAVIALAGAFFAGDLTFWHLSIVNTSIANATLLATLAPIYVTIGMFVFFGQRVSRTFLAGMALAIGGAAVLIGDSLALKPENLLGDFYGLITGMFFGAYIIAVGRARLRQPTARVMSWSTLVTAGCLLFVTWASGEGMVARTVEGWGILLALAAVSHAGGQGLIAFALAHLPTAFSSVTLILEAVFAALLAWVIFAEPLGPWQWLGAAVIVAGIVVARLGSRKPAAA